MSSASALVFDRYQIVRRLAIGGMGEIFLARQHGVAGFDRLVILKSLLPELARDDSAVQQFLDEARVAATLNHPNIVSIYEVGSWQGSYFIAMEYIRGESVANIASSAWRNAAFPLPIACRVIHDVALALDHAHHALDANGMPVNVVHRDISPQNVMIRVDGVTKVLDFGIAKAANSLSRTTTGQVKGKLAYMAPEQVSGQQLDGRCDQFALGILMWEIISGERLFQADTPVQTVTNLTTGRIPPLREKRPEVPPELEAIVARMLERDREARYPRCRDVCDALRPAILIDEARDERVADFVHATVGAELQARDSELTARRDFVIDLRQQREILTAGHIAEDDQTRITLTDMLDGDAPSMAPTSAYPVQRSKRPLVLALVAAVMVIGVPLAWRLAREESFEPAAPVAPIAKVDENTVKAEPTVAVEPRPDKPVEPPKPTASVTPTKAKTKTAPVITPVAVAPVVSPKADGTLSVATQPWTEVSIDGAMYGSTPVFKIKLAPGSHTVRLRNEGAGIDVTKTVNVEPEQNAKLNLSLP